MEASAPPEGSWEEEEEGGRKGSSLSPLLYNPLVVCGYGAVGKDSALALRLSGVMAGMYQKGSSTLVVVYGSGMCNAGLAGYDAPRVVFLFWRRQAPGCSAS